MWHKRQVLGGTFHAFATTMTSKAQAFRESNTYLTCLLEPQKTWSWHRVRKRNTSMSQVFLWCFFVINRYWWMCSAGWPRHCQGDVMFGLTLTLWRMWSSVTCRTVAICSTCVSCATMHCSCAAASPKAPGDVINNIKVKRQAENRGAIRLAGEGVMATDEVFNLGLFIH